MDRFAPILLFLAALIAFAIGIWELPVLDRDEARFAQAARQMVATGDYVDIRFHDGPRHNKPISIYWLQSVMLWVFGEAGIWVHRLVSVIAAALAAVALVWAGRPLVGRQASLWAGLILATIFMTHAEARIAKTDATLLLTIILAMGALARVWMERDISPWIAAAFWTALAAGLLVKGPIILMPVGGAILWLTIRERGLGWMAGLRPLPGLAWALLLTAPWYIAIIWITDGGFIMDSLVADLGNKVVTEDEADGTPPGTYLIAFWLSFWPWGLLAPLAAVWAWRNRATPQVAFLLGWSLPTWIVFELIPTKLLHYTLPTYPAIALACGVVLAGLITDGRGLRGWAGHIGAALFAIATLGYVGLIVAAPMEWAVGPLLWPIIVALIALAFATAGLIWLYRAQAARGALAVAASGVVMFWALFAMTLPNLSNLWITPRLANAMAQHQCLSGPVAMVGFHEPSTVFTFGRDTQLMSAEDAVAYLAAGENRAAWIPSASLAELGLEASGGIPDLTEVSGQNYSNGRDVSLRLVISPGEPAPATPCP